MNPLSKNIKKLRLENGLTQEELAKKLNVTFQTVSKWETGVNYPDVLCMPDIAEAFDVSIDELYKGDLSSYKNKAERLLSKYESDITDDIVYKKALEEFKDLELSNDLDNIDMTNYGYLHYLRAEYHLHIAKKWYSTYLKNEKNCSNEYYKKNRQLIKINFMLGKNKDYINNLLNKTSKNMQEYGLLMYAFIIERNYQEAYKVGKEILQKYNNAYLLTLFGDACIGVHKNDEAIKALEQAFELEPTIIDTQYSLYNIYKNTNIDKAKETLNYIKKYNDDNNLEFENKWVNKELAKYL